MWNVKKTKRQLKVKPSCNILPIKKKIREWLGSEIQYLLGACELVKKLWSILAVACGMCGKIKELINRIISRNVLPASPFASTTRYQSEQPPKTLASAAEIYRWKSSVIHWKRLMKPRDVIVIYNLYLWFINYNLLIINYKMMIKPLIPVWAKLKQINSFYQFKRQI